MSTNIVASDSKSNVTGSGKKQSAGGIVILNKASSEDAIAKKKESNPQQNKCIEKQTNVSPNLEAASKLPNPKKRFEGSSRNNSGLHSNETLNRSSGVTIAPSHSKSRGEVQGLSKSGAAAASNSYLEKARQSSSKVNVVEQPKQSSSTTTQVTVTKKKHRPTETLELDLLTLALQAKKNEEERKQHQARQFHNRSSGAAAAAAAAREKDAELSEKKIGKVRGAGEIARRKNRLSSLKKRILQERRVRWWLLHPDVEPFPLVSHPALVEHECIWLNHSRALDTPLSHDSSSTKDESDESEEEDDEIDDLSEQSNIEEDDDEKESHEPLDYDEEEQEKVDSCGDDQECKVNGPVANDKNKSEEEQNNHIKGSLHRAATGSVPFDPLLASPVYFGAFYRRLPPNASSPSILDNDQADVKTKSFTKKGPRPLPNARPVRDYVTQALSKQLDELCLQMLAQLFKYQERARTEDPVNAKLRRRLVMGLHEVRRGVRSHRCIAVVIVPNVEDAEGLDEKLQEILSLCKENNTKLDDDLWRPIPVIFASNKRHLGRALGKRAAVSCVGIYSADGAHEQFKLCLKLAEKLAGFWKSQVTEEARLAGLGRRITCASCLSILEGSVRRDCLNCKRTFCEPCASRSVAKKEVCISQSTTAQATCEIVRVSRTAPKIAKKSLSVGAKEFVPPTLANIDNNNSKNSSASPQQQTSVLSTVSTEGVSKTALKLNPAAEEYKPPSSSSMSSLLDDNSKTIVT